MDIDQSFVEKYLERYDETQGVLPEQLETWGETYREQEHLTREQLYEIAYASSTRSAYHVRDNPEERCITITQVVYRIEDAFAQAALLSSLNGFKAPTASCVLAALNPDRHAVVDTRVWASLERCGRVNGRKESFDAEDYVTMLDEIQEVSEATGFRPVDVGYALFAYDVDVREGTLH